MNPLFFRKIPRLMVNVQDYVANLVDLLNAFFNSPALRHLVAHRQ